MRGMLIFTAEGPRRVDDREVIAVYRENVVGGYCNSGSEIGGRLLRGERDIPLIFVGCTGSALCL